MVIPQRSDDKVAQLGKWTSEVALRIASNSVLAADSQSASATQHLGQSGIAGVLLALLARTGLGVVG